MTEIVKTTITVEILHNKDLGIDDMSMEEIEFESREGQASLRYAHFETSEPLTEDELKKECDLHGTDVDFFGSDSEEVETCRTCGTDLSVDAGEGCDGECGKCADKRAQLEEEEVFDTGDFDE